MYLGLVICIVIVLFLCRFAILAGDADPMDVVSHLPIFFEENHVPYTWVPTRRVSC